MYLLPPVPWQIAIHTLWNIRVVVLAKPEHENRISHISTDNVKTGIANTLGEETISSVGLSFTRTLTGNSSLPLIMFLLPWSSPAWNI